MGGSVHIHIDSNVCQGHGQCVEWLPEVFKMGPDGISQLVNENPDESLRARVLDAVKNCPVGAISAHD